MTQRFVFRTLVLCTIVAGYWWYVGVWLPLRYDAPIVRVHFLNVGQGDAILIETPNQRRVLVDAGRGVATVTALDQVIVAGDTRIDVAVMTHPDADHIGGFAAVFDRYRVSAVLHSFIPATTGVYAAVMDRVQKMAEQGVSDVYAIDRAYAFSLDDVTFTLIWPLDRTVADRNAASLVLLVRYGHSDVLLTGDAPRAVERVLLAAAPDLLTDIEVVKAGHHGSRTALSPELLAYTKPQAIVFSYGEENQYGHPHSTVLQQVASYLADTQNARAYRTVDGTISFCLTKEAVSHC